MAEDIKMVSITFCYNQIDIFVIQKQDTFLIIPSIFLTAIPTTPAPTLPTAPPPFVEIGKYTESCIKAGSHLSDFRILTQTGAIEKIITPLHK